MTAHLGTFIPLHAQNPGWGLTGWNQNSSWSQSAPWGQNASWNQSAPWGQHTSWNQSAPWGQNTSWNQSAPWGQNTSWNQSAPWGQNTSWNQSAPWGQNTSWNQSAPWGQNTSWNQSAPWGQNTSWNQSAPWGQNTSWNQSAPWGQNTSWSQNAPWGQNTSWSQSAPWGQHTSWNQSAPWGQDASVPTSGYSYGSNLGETAHGGAHSASTLAFVPHHGHVSGNTFVPASTALQGIATGKTVVGIPAAWQGGNQAIGGFATELSENNHEYVLSFDVPGIEIADLDVSLAENTILINGIRKSSHESATLAYSEVARGSISRAIAVPFDVSPSKAINTSLENGVLKIRIAKENQAHKTSSARKVKIG